MLKRFLIVLFALSLVLACEEILEEMDISNDQVTVFAPLDSVTIPSNTVNFNWDALEFADSYRFQLGQPNFESATQLVLDTIFREDSLNQVATQIQQTLVNGAYEWRIKALNGSFETSYTTNSFVVQGDEDLDTTAPNTPQLEAPANGSTQLATTVDFSWTREDVDGTAEFDSIFLYDDENRTNIILRDIGANKAYSTTVESATYYWEVRAYDTAGNESSPSALFSFTIN